MLSHSLTVVGITEALMKALEFNEEDIKIGLVTAFFHDILKEGKSSWSEMEKRGRLVDKEFEKEDFEEISKILGGLRFSKDEIEQVQSILPYGSLQSGRHLKTLLREKPNRDNPKVRKIVHDIADHLASLKSLNEFSENLSLLEKKMEKYNLKIEYHKVGVIRGILTSILHQTIQEIYEESGFEPILFFPDGTVYIGKDTAKIDLASFEEKFKENFWLNLKTFIEGVPVSTRADASVGPYTQTKIPSPELAYMSDDTIEAVWKRIRSLKTVTNHDIKGNLEGYTKILEDKGERILEDEVNDYLKEILGLFVLFYYFKSVCEDAAGLDNWANTWKKNLALRDLESAYNEEELSKYVDFEKFIEVIEKLSHSGKGAIEKRINGGLLFRSLFPEDLNRDNVLDEAASLCKKLSKVIRPYAEKNKGLKSVDIPGNLLQELSRPLLVNPEIIVDEVWREYSKGKTRDGTVICPICDRLGLRKIKGKKVGAGESKSFTNFLKGGTRLTRRDICALCDLEMTIRTLYLGTGDFEDYYLIPQVNLSPVLASRWAEAAGELVSMRGMLGLEPITRNLTWARRINEEGVFFLNNKIPKILNSFLKTESRRAESHMKETIQGKIDVEFGGSFEIFKHAMGLETETIDETVENIIGGTLKIPEELEEEFKNKVNALIAINTPNYALISYPRRGLEAEDHKSSNYVRHLFRGALLSRLFLASVVVKELKYEPLTEIKAQGAVKIPTNTQFDRAFALSGIKLSDGWLKLEDVDKAIVKLSTLFLIDNILKRLNPSSKSRKGELIMILKDYPGRTLNRIQQLSKGDNDLWEAVKLLGILFEKEVVK